MVKKVDGLTGALDGVFVNDTMRFSTELLKEIDAMPDRRSVLVRVVEVQVEGDGSKTLLLQKVDPAVQEQT